ncbi:MAG: transcription termination factor Rho [Verrucomicrobia bacterium]|nr:MAG: transcription termination factor Rho [Verrucomicrobiota bacterium]
MQARAQSGGFEASFGAETQVSAGEHSAPGENALQPSESPAAGLADGAEASEAPSSVAQPPAENGISDSSARPAPFPAEPYDPACADSFKISDSESIGSLSGFDEIYALTPKEMQAKFDEIGVEYARGAGKCDLAVSYYKYARGLRRLVKLGGVLDVFGDGCGGALTYSVDSYRLRRSCVYVPQGLIDAYKLQRGHELEVLATLPEDSDATGSNCPVAVKIVSVAGGDPAAVAGLVPFTDLVPYYPTQRMIMEAPECAKWDNLSMRAVDLLTPIGRGQRALIVAPPRTGKTVLMQGMAKSIRLNSPDAHLMILLVDERPEEVTDFKRNVDAEVVSSTFDEDANSHVHAAEMVISRARRMVEAGRDVVILLDSITRLARAYNALMPNGGRTMSGGVEANALQKPKRFFGSARNIEGGGSLTIIGTALVETGSKMDEVIFEEFKGTGNLELHLDRQLSDKRVFPAINMEKSGTRKEELLYHPDELKKIYALRRAMKGVPAADAMEMLIQRLKKVKTNVEFLMGLNS